MKLDSLPERFAGKVAVDEGSGCWVWQASTDANGYGFFWSDGRMRRAHRVSYALLVGDVPDGLTLDHLCRNRACVNPAHLEPVTAEENTSRSHAMRTRRIFCLRGHALSGSNLYVAPKTGARGCRACRAMQSRNRKKVAL